MSVGKHVRKQHGKMGIAILLGLLCLFATRLHAQVTDVPINLQVPLAIKALDYSKGLAGKLRNGKLVIGICYQEKFRRSFAQMEELVDALEREKPSYTIQIVRIPIDDAGRPIQPIQWKKLSCVYFTVLRAATPAPILSETQPLQLISLSADPTAARTHVAMAFELIGGRAKIAINRAHADKEGCEFSSQLLKLAIIY
jgi:hypothetical protein